MSKDDIQIDSNALRPNYKIISSLSEPVYTLITDGTEQLTVEDGAAETIDFAHAKIHEGNGYIVSKLFLSVADDSYADLHIMTGSTKETHMLMEISAVRKSYISLYRGTTYSNIGTTVAVFNSDDSSSNTTASSVYSSPTVTTLGTLLLQDLIPAGTNSKTVGGVSNTRAERILRTSTDYLLRVQNVSNNTSDIAIQFDYYEISD